MELKQEIKKYSKIIEENLEKELQEDDPLQKKIIESMKYSLFAGGKRLRPTLLLKSCELISNSYTEAIPLAMSIEMIHTYSLIHDDLPAMDNDDYRRGKLTNHKVYGEAMAILAGDGLLNLAYEIMIKSVPLDDNKKYRNYLKAMREISRAAGVYGIIGGQSVDILSENKKTDEKELNFIHKNKTSALIEASIKAGALVGGASEKELKNLEIYGESIGLGYQIRDDILDKVGSIEKLGKDIGSDEKKNKATYVSLHSLDKAIDETEKMCNQAIESLEIFDKDTSFFKELARYLVNREY